MVFNRMYKINRDDSLSTTIIANYKKFKNTPSLNQTNIVVSSAASHKDVDKTYTVSLTKIRSYLGKNENYDMNSFQVEMKKQPNASTTMKVSLKKDFLRFASEESKGQDASKTILATGYSKIFSKYKLLVSTDANFGSNKMESDGTSNGDSTFGEMSVSIKRNILNILTTITAGYMVEGYADVNKSFGVKRKDTQRSLSVSLVKPISNNMDATLGLGYRLKDSNIEMYDVNSKSISVGIIRKF